MFIGIDLGTTNSSITSFDGKETRVHKSLEGQSDVTPSVIHIDKRGGKYYGHRAYNNEPYDPNNTAKLFKRKMGTNTKILFENNNLEMTPEECSTEILKVLYGYLPEDIRNDKNTATVITVPAAFNQMQKDATNQAAYNAGINKVALMQEPVAAIMSIGRVDNINGLFIVYDFGGGTFDISIAERVGNKINLLTNDGIQHCGGRDFDLLLYENIVKKWLYQNFKLPKNLKTKDKYSTLFRLALWATEKAKIELSANEDAMVSLAESVIRCEDENGKEIYLDVPISRDSYNKLINSKIDETIEKARAVIKNAGLKPEDINHIVFVGGPTCYKPLRDRVSSSLGITTNIDVNPITAVSEGAAIYAETIDFTSEKGGQKADKGIIKSSNFNLEFRYNARISSDKAKIAVVFKNASTLDFIFKNLDTGWNSGKLSLKSGSIATVDLPNSGENKFLVECFDEHGKEVKLEEKNIAITKTLINIGNIPIAHSIAIEIEDPITKNPTLSYLIKKDDLLPKSGVEVFKATKRISAGDSEKILVKLWEGESSDPIANRMIGHIQISGASFDYGMIPVGSPIEAHYSFSAGGNIELKVSIPAIGRILPMEKSYNRQDGQVDYADESAKEDIIDEATEVLDKISELNENIYDKKLDEISNKINVYMDKEELDAEDAQALFETTQESKTLVASYMKDNQTIVWQQELDKQMKLYQDVAKNATQVQEKQVNNLKESIQNAINANNPQAEILLEELRKINMQILLNDDSAFVLIFMSMIQNPQDFTNSALFNQLVNQGHHAIQKNDIGELRNIVSRLSQIMIRRKGSEIDNMLNRSGITK